MDLLGTIIIPLTEDQKVRVAAIDQEDYSGVKRLVLKDDPFLTATELEEGILGLKQYYAVALLDGKNQHAVSVPIDPYWHAHILHTRQYHAFCDTVFGQYIHHEPLDPANTERVKYVERRYSYTLMIYERMFSRFSEKLYPAMGPCGGGVVCLHYELREDNPLREQAFFGKYDFSPVFG